MCQHHAADSRRFIDAPNPRDRALGGSWSPRSRTRNSLVMVAERSGGSGRELPLRGSSSPRAGWSCADRAASCTTSTSTRRRAGRTPAARSCGRGSSGSMAKGRSQVVLLTKTGNEHAQRLFASIGFRQDDDRDDSGSGPRRSERPCMTQDSYTLKTWESFYVIVGSSAGALDRTPVRRAHADHRGRHPDRQRRSRWPRSAARTSCTSCAAC